MRRLETYGSHGLGMELDVHISTRVWHEIRTRDADPAAAPEVLEELREACGQSEGVSRSSSHARGTREELHNLG